jgi:hypothetical protein
VRVVDERTRVPAAGAWVAPQGERSIAPTGADGLATLTALPADGEVVMSIETIGGTVWGRRFERRVRPGSGEIHELAVEVYPRSATLRAVQARSRLPLVGARYRRVIVPSDLRALDAVVASDDVPESAWETVDLEPAVDGTVTIELPANEAAIIVLAEAEGHLASRCVVVADGESIHEIPLWPIVGVPIELFADGRPLVGGAMITMDSVAVLQQSPPGPRSVRPGTGPRLQFGNVANSRAVVAADDRGHATLPLPEIGVPETIRLRVVASDGRSRDFGELLRRDLPDPPWQLDVAPGHATATVRVLDGEGTPIAGVPVEMSGNGVPEHLPAHESAVRRATFLTGQLVPRSGRLPEAQWRARIEARRLDDAGAPSGRPLRGTIGRDGAFRIGVLEAGRYELRLSASSASSSGLPPLIFRSSLSPRVPNGVARGVRSTQRAIPQLTPDAHTRHREARDGRTRSVTSPAAHGHRPNVTRQG